MKPKYLEIHDSRTGRLVCRSDISTLTPQEIQSTIEAEGKFFNHFCTITQNGIKPVGFPIRHDDWASDLERDGSLYATVVVEVVLALCVLIAVYSIIEYIF